MSKTPGSKRYQTDDEGQITYTYASAPRGGGHYVLFEHPDGFVPRRPGAVLLGVRHAPLDVSNSTTAGCVANQT